MRPSVAAIGLVVLGFFTIVAVPDGRALEATPSTLTFTAVQGGPNPVTRALSFLKNTTRERNWATSSTADWLRVTVSPAHLVPRDRLLVSVDVAGLTEGVYKGTVSIAGMKGEPISVPVTLTITGRTHTTRTSSALSAARMRLSSDTDPERD